MIQLSARVLEESWVGIMATSGDPVGRQGSWLLGADFTYATSRFRGDKNFLFGVWALATGREDLGGDATAHGSTTTTSARSPIAGSSTRTSCS